MPIGGPRTSSALETVGPGTSEKVRFKFALFPISGLPASMPPLSLQPTPRLKLVKHSPPCMMSRGARRSKSCGAKERIMPA